jgi:hypothetical protein
MRIPRRLPALEIQASLLLALTFGAAPWVPAAENGGENGGSKASPVGGSKEGNGAAPDSFTVIQVGEKVSVLKQSEVPAFRKKVSDEYDASLKAYNQAKQKAAKARKKFDTEKPARPTVKTVASALKTQESAKAIQEKTVAQIADRKKKERERKEKERAKNGKNGK